MKMRVLAALLWIAAVSAGVLHTQSAVAQTAAVRLLASNGVQGALNELIPQCEKAIGHPIGAEFATTNILKPRIAAGEAFDLTFLTAEALDELIAAGKISADSRVDVAKVGIGVGIRAGAAKPDVSTPDALKKTLLAAHSITYAKAGASRPLIDKMLDKMGIADALKSKTLLLPGAEDTTAAIAGGKAEILLTLVSEIVSAKGVQLDAPLPKEYQAYVAFAAGISPSAKNPEAAKAALKFLISPKAAAAYKSKGMELK